MDMTLEEWRIEKGLTYRELADLIGAATATLARRYALGLSEAGAPLKERARIVSDGRVTPEGFHRARLSQTQGCAPAPEPVS